MEAIRILGAVLGVIIMAGTGASILQTLVTPGGRVGRLFRTVDRITDDLFRFICRPFPDYHQRFRIQSYEAPVELAVALFLWLALFLIAFALMLWPLIGGLATSFREAGSSLFTLGFASSVRNGATVVDILAALTGLTVVAMLIGYLPTLYSAFNRRETEVTLLAVRAGTPNWGPELLARSRYTITTGELPQFYRQWERWAADVAESHSSYPILLRFRSPHVKSNWLIAMLAVMDSAALWSAVAPDDLPIQGRLCLAMGFRALRQLASTVGIPFDEDPRPDDGIQLTRAEFDQGIARLQQVGFPMTRTPDEAWPHFQGWRVNYESIVYRLAWTIDAVPAAWSGPRRSGEAAIFPVPVVNRTPESPEGTPVGFLRPPADATSRPAADATSRPA